MCVCAHSSPREGRASENFASPRRRTVLENSGGQEPASQFLICSEESGLKSSTEFLKAGF